MIYRKEIGLAEGSSLLAPLVMAAESRAHEVPLTARPFVHSLQIGCGSLFRCSSGWR
jgi:hypothetical protein